MNPNEFFEWLEQQIAFTEGFRNHVPKTKEENRHWNGKIDALKEVMDKCLNTKPND